MTNNSNVVRKLIDVNPDIYQKAKIAAVMEGKPLYKWIEEAFLSKLNGSFKNADK